MNEQMIYAPDKPVEDTYSGKNTRAIQIVPRSRIRLINKYRVWRKEHENKQQTTALEGELRHLEDNKSQFSKSKYMIEQGSVERVQRKIDRVKEQLVTLEINRDIINNLKYELHNEKPLRLIPSMFNVLKNTYYVAAAKLAKKTEQRISEEAINVTDFSRENVQENIQAESINNQEIRPAVNSDIIYDEVNNDIERPRIRSLPSANPARFEVSVGTSEDVNAVDFNKSEPVMDVKGEFVDERPATSVSNNSNKAEVVAMDNKVNDFFANLEGSMQKAFDDKKTSVEDEIDVKGKFSFDNSKDSLNKDNSNVSDIDFSNGSITSLEEMKEGLLKLQQLRDLQNKKREQASKKKEEAIQNKEVATKEKEKMMKKYAEYAKALQQEINESMKIEAEENKIAATAQQQAEQNLAETRAIEEMLSPSFGSSSEEMSSGGRSLAA